MAGGQRREAQACGSSRLTLLLLLAACCACVRVHGVPVAGGAASVALTTTTTSSSARAGKATGGRTLRPSNSSCESDAVQLAEVCAQRGVCTSPLLPWASASAPSSCDGLNHSRFPSLCDAPAESPLEPSTAVQPPLPRPKPSSADHILSFDDYKRSVAELLEAAKRKERESGDRSTLAPAEAAAAPAVDTEGAAVPPPPPPASVFEAAASAPSAAVAVEETDAASDAGTESSPGAAGADAPPSEAAVEASLPPPSPAQLPVVLGVSLGDDRPDGGSPSPGPLRYNYASERNGAKVLAANREAKNALSALSEDRDAYLISPCAAQKWLVVELSEEVRVESLVLANWEFYSAPIKELDLFSARHYPPAEWAPLARLQATPQRGSHLFQLPHPPWARFLLLALRSQHGEARFCTLSALAVHGMDAAETLREEMALAEAEVGQVNHALRVGSGGAEQGAQGGEEEGLAVSPATEEVGGHAQETPNPEATAGGERAGGEPAATSSEGARGEASGAAENAAAAPAVEQQAPPTAPSAAPLSPQQQPPGDVSPDAPAADAPADGAQPARVQAQPASGPSPPPGGDDNIFRTLVHKLKGLELNVSLIDRYMTDTNARYVDTFRELEADVAALERDRENASAVFAALGGRLAALEQRAQAEAQLAREAAQRAVQEALAPLMEQLGGLQAAARSARARELAGAALVAMLAAALLLLRAQDGDGAQAKGPASAEVGVPARAVATLRSCVAVLTLSNGALGLALRYASRA